MNYQLELVMTNSEAWPVFVRYLTNWTSVGGVGKNTALYYFSVLKEGRPFYFRIVWEGWVKMCGYRRRFSRGRVAPRKFEMKGVGWF